MPWKNYLLSTCNYAVAQKHCYCVLYNKTKYYINYAN